MNKSIDRVRAEVSLKIPKITNSYLRSKFTPELIIRKIWSFFKQLIFEKAIKNNCYFDESFVIVCKELHK
jgi:hypothetical protein